MCLLINRFSCNIIVLIRFLTLRIHLFNAVYDLYITICNLTYAPWEQWDRFLKFRWSFIHSILNSSFRTEFNPFIQHFMHGEHTSTTPCVKLLSVWISSIFVLGFSTKKGYWFMQIDQQVSFYMNSPFQSLIQYSNHT